MIGIVQVYKCHNYKSNEFYVCNRCISIIIYWWINLHTSLNGICNNMYADAWVSCSLCIDHSDKSNSYEIHF